MSAQPPQGTPPGPPGYPGQPYPGYPAPYGAQSQYPAYPGYPGYSYPGYGYAYAMTPPGPAPGVIYQPFWGRFGAYLLDSLIMGVPLGILGWVLVFGPWFEAVQATISSSGYPYRTPVLPQYWDVVPMQRIVTYIAVAAVIELLYFGAQVGMWGRTLGHRVIGAQVVKEESGEPIGLGRALARSVVFWGPGLAGFVPGVGSILGLLGFIALFWAAWDPRKQGLHDKLGRALVVKRLAVMPAYPAGPYPGARTPPPGAPGQGMP